MRKQYDDFTQLKLKNMSVKVNIKFSLSYISILTFTTSEFVPILFMAFHK